MLAAAMMLDHLERREAATRLRKAISDTLNVDGVRTGDLGGTATTASFTQTVAQRIKGQG
jgi:isocitrate dehydrogenase (NAD+)